MSKSNTWIWWVTSAILTLSVAALLIGIFCPDASAATFRLRAVDGKLLIDDVPWAMPTLVAGHRYRFDHSHRSTRDLRLRLSSSNGQHGHYGQPPFTTHFLPRRAGTYRLACSLGFVNFKVVTPPPSPATR
mgnify:CR=1 FL=1